MKTQPFNPRRDVNLAIEGIVAAPLVAAARANSMLGGEQVQLLIDYCFSKRGEVYDPVMVKFTLTQGMLDPSESLGDDSQVQEITTAFYVPVITLLPISSISVDTVTASFEIELSTYVEREQGAHQGLLGTAGAPRPHPQLRGRVSYDSKERAHKPDSTVYRSESPSKLNISVSAGPLPLAVGVQAIISLYANAISPLSLDEPPEPSLTFG